MNDAMTPPGWRLHDDEGFVGLVGPVWERWEDGALVLAFTAEPRHANQAGVVQGGMLVTLADAGERRVEAAARRWRTHGPVFRAFWL